MANGQWPMANSKKIGSRLGAYSILVVIDYFKAARLISFAALAFNEASFDTALLS